MAATNSESNGKDSNSSTKAAESAKSNDESEFKIDGELIAQGAEAKVYKSVYKGDKEGKMTIVKHRFPKRYRHPQLDHKLRRNRSKKEQKCLRKAKTAGIRVPEILYCDNKHCAIHMEFVDLPTVKTVLIKYFDAKTRKYNTTQCTPILTEIGRNLAILHQNDLIHGDLTTSNMLLDEKESQNEQKEKDENEDMDINQKNRCEVVMIDFGLSEGTTRAEDKAVDIYVLERALISTHPESEFMVDIILESYSKHYPSKQKEVLKRLDQVRLRGRKRSMIG